MIIMFSFAAAVIKVAMITAVFFAFQEVLLVGDVKQIYAHFV